MRFLMYEAENELEMVIYFVDTAVTSNYNTL